MPAPYYVSPEQMMQDKAEYARKGIARGRSIIAMGYDDGILLLADNASSLNKISEVYDKIGFAGAGKYSEFENLRKAGIRHADMRGYLYSRQDVTARSLANAYSQMLGTIFSQDVKPFEVEILVAEVGADPDADGLYRISFDGSIFDEKGFTVIGGKADTLYTYLKGRYTRAPLKETLNLAMKTLGEGYQQEVTESGLEVAVLSRSQAGRAFRRLSPATLKGFLSNPDATGLMSSMRMP